MGILDAKHRLELWLGNFKSPLAIVVFVNLDVAMVLGVEELVLFLQPEMRFRVEHFGFRR